MRKYHRTNVEEGLANPLRSFAILLTEVMEDTLKSESIILKTLIIYFQS
jgi:hypothetical protein